MDPRGRWVFLHLGNIGLQLIALLIGPVGLCVYGVLALLVSLVAAHREERFGFRLLIGFLLDGMIALPIGMVLVTHEMPPRIPYGDALIWAWMPVELGLMLLAGVLSLVERNLPGRD